MANTNNQLATCYVCNGSVSKKAKTCPHCGQDKPVKAAPTRLSTKLIVFFLLFIIIAPPIISNHNPAPPEQPVPDFARDICLNAIKASVHNPSTLDIHMITGYAAQVVGNGVVRMTQTFSAKNAFGLRKTFDAHCTIYPNRKLDLQVIEQGG